MAFDLFSKKTASPATVLPVLPEEIYETGVLGTCRTSSRRTRSKSTHANSTWAKKSRAPSSSFHTRDFSRRGGSHPSSTWTKSWTSRSSSTRWIPTKCSVNSRKKWRKCRARSRPASRRGWCVTRCSIPHTQTSNNCAIRSSRRRSVSSDVGLYLTIYGNTREEVDKVESEVRSILESRLVYIRPALFQQEQGFRSRLAAGPRRTGRAYEAQFRAALFDISVHLLRPHHRQRHPLRHQPAQFVAHPLRPFLLGRTTTP